MYGASENGYNFTNFGARTSRFCVVVEWDIWNVGNFRNYRNVRNVRNFGNVRNVENVSSDRHTPSVIHFRNHKLGLI